MTNFLREEVKESIIFNSLSLISKDSRIVERDIFSLVELEDIVFKTLL